MSYEKLEAGYEALNLNQQMPEFASFLKNVRVSQVVQEKIIEVNRNLKKLQDESHISENTSGQLENIEEQMAELLRIRTRYLKKN